MDDIESDPLTTEGEIRPICLAIAVGCILAFLVMPLIGAAAALFFAPLTIGIPIALGAIAFCRFAWLSDVVELSLGRTRWRYDPRLPPLDAQDRRVEGR